MNENLLAKILISVSVLCISVSAFIVLSPMIKTENIAAALSISPKKIKVLIVPGHEPNKGGADEYKKIKERDLNLQLSEILKNNLSDNKKIEVILARDKDGWNKDLEKFVTTNETEIMNWVALMKEKLLAKVDSGEFKVIDPNMKHNDAESSAVLFLYGTNKWIDEKNIDLVLHVHFNSNPKINGKPNYRGYSIYIPDKQYANADQSKRFADYVNEEIVKIQKPSNMPQEKETIISSQELIAVGNYDTLKIPSVVVEYAYMYESLMTNTETRNAFIEKAASSTATAIENFIEKEILK